MFAHSSVAAVSDRRRRSEIDATNSVAPYKIKYALALNLWKPPSAFGARPRALPPTPQADMESASRVLKRGEFSVATQVRSRACCPSTLTAKLAVPHQSASLLAFPLATCVAARRIPPNLNTLGAGGFAGFSVRGRRLGFLEALIGTDLTPRNAGCVFAPLSHFHTTYDEFARGKVLRSPQLFTLSIPPTPA